MKNRLLSLALTACVLAVSCAPQSFILNSEMRGPSASGLDLGGKSMAVVYLYANEADTLFGASLASGFATRLEEDYFGGNSFVDIYKMPFRRGADYSAKDSLVALVMDTGKDVVFVFDTPQFGTPEVSAPVEVKTKPASKDSSYISSATVPFSMKLYVYDSMNKEDKVLGFGGSQEIKQAVYCASPARKPSGSALWRALAPSAEQIGYQAGESFLSTWLPDSFYVIYYDGAEKAWNRGAEHAYHFEWKEAVDEWLTLVQTRNPEKKACACYNIALGCFMLGQYDLAVEWLDRSDKVMPVSLSKRLRGQIEKYVRK